MCLLLNGLRSCNRKVYIGGHFSVEQNDVCRKAGPSLIFWPTVFYKVFLKYHQIAFLETLIGCLRWAANIQNCKYIAFSDGYPKTRGENPRLFCYPNPKSDTRTKPETRHSKPKFFFGFTISLLNFYYRGRIMCKWLKCFGDWKWIGKFFNKNSKIFSNSLYL